MVFCFWGLACGHGLFFPSFALIEAVTITVHLENIDVMGQAVEQRASESVGAEGLGPFVEGQIAGDHGRAAFIALREDFKQQLRPGFAQWHKTQLVNDQQFILGELFLETQQDLFVAGLHQLMDQGTCGDKTNTQAFLARGQAKSEGNVGFAGAARPKRDDILAPFNIFTAGKIQHLHLVEIGNGFKVKAVEAFDRRELRQPDPPFNHPTFAARADARKYNNWRLCRRAAPIRQDGTGSQGDPLLLWHRAVPTCHAHAGKWAAAGF